MVRVLDPIRIKATVAGRAKCASVRSVRSKRRCGGTMPAGLAERSIIRRVLQAEGA